MILWNTPEVRAAMWRALTNLERFNEGAVMHLDMVGGDVQLCLLADRPLAEEDAYAIRFSTAY